MNTYTALVTVSYHSGSFVTQVQVAAENVYMARVLLDNLYGADKVMSQPTQVI